MVIKSDKNMAPFTDHTIYNHNAPWRQAMPQILAVCVKNILLLGFGMTLGFPTILIPSLSGDNPNETFRLGQEAISWIGSLNLICVPIGCLISGAVTQPLGRRRAMQFVNIPFIISWLLFHFSTEVWQVFLALAIHGVTGGLLEAPVLTYVAEITQPSLRGILASTSSVCVIVGVLAQFLLGTFYNWKTVALFSVIVPVISLISLFFVPESPHWLISKNKFDQARRSLSWLRGWTSLEDIEPEFQDLCRQMKKTKKAGIDNPAFDGDNSSINAAKTTYENSKNPSIFYWKLYTKKNFLWPYGLVVFIFFLGHFCGMTTLQTYAVKIFSTLKSPIDKYYATVGLGVAEVTGCIVSSCLVYEVGKRKMNFFSLILGGSCFFVVGLYAYMADIKYLSHVGIDSKNVTYSNDTEANVLLENYNWVPTTCLITAAFAVHTGIRILPWMLIGEVYSPETRSNASGLSGGMSYVFSFTVNKTFLKMISFFTLAGTYWFYSAVNFIGLIILYFILPETEGKTLYEITEHFAGNTKLNNKVYNERKIKKKGKVNPGFEEDRNGIADSKM